MAGDECRDRGNDGFEGAPDDAHPVMSAPTSRVPASATLLTGPA
jgi:hypothetical protein